MEIKNLSQMKKTVNAHVPFVIVKHYIHPELEGQIRMPNVLQTNGFYSVEKDKPNSDVSQANNGKGYWLGYGKASDWIFQNGTCTLMDGTNPVWEIRFEQ